MSLHALRIHWVKVPLHEPFRISNGAITVKDAILVELNDDGVRAWGEASPMAGAFYSAETPESTWNFLRDQLLPALLKNPQNDPKCCAEWLEQFSGEPFARAGLEGAVWDLAAKKQSQPLWKLLGGARRAIESGAAIGLMPSLEDLLARVERFLREGYRRIKIKIEPGHDVELVRAIRARFGDIRLMVDANSAYSLEDLPVFEALDQLGLMMIEQPLAREALEEHADLQRRIKTPICLDESAESLNAIRTIIRLGSARILNIKVQRMGGLWAARQAHDVAHAAGIPCWLGTMPELGVASAQGLHLATLPGFTLPTDVEASARWYVDEITSPAIEISSDGHICLTDTPGTGHEVDCKKVARYRIAQEEFRA